MADRLAALMAHFPVSAHVFNAGPLCGINAVEDPSGRGQLHLVRDGAVEVQYGREALQVERPSLLLFARPLAHRFVTDPERGADMVCAHLSFEGGAGNPIAASLPPLVCLPLDEVAGAAPVLGLLFEEAFEQRCGRMALVERLFEVVMIQVLRQLMERDGLRAGMLSGLAHPRLRGALAAMHDAPAREWTLDALANAAGMSRSVFAAAFRDTVGTTPGQYLQEWRIGLAQQALRRGRPLKAVAADVVTAARRRCRARSRHRPGARRANGAGNCAIATKPRKHRAARYVAAAAPRASRHAAVSACIAAR